MKNRRPGAFVLATMFAARLVGVGASAADTSSNAAIDAALKTAYANTAAIR